MRALANHFTFEFNAGLRNAAAMLMFYLFPLGFYLLMGLVMVELNPDFLMVMIPALVVVTAMAGTVLGLPSQIVDAREAGIYRSFKINKVPISSILIVPILAATVHALVASSVIAVTAGPFFGAEAPVNWLAFVGLTLLAGLSFGAVAALIGVVSAGIRGTVLWSQLIFIPSMLVGGLMVDLAVLPESMLPAAKMLPSTYAMQALIGAAFEADTVIDAPMAIMILAVTGVTATALARLLFAWDPGNQSRRRPVWLALAVLVPLAAGALLS